MSQILYTLVVLQGTSLSFSPGYTSAAECLAVYKGPAVACFAYDPEGTTWTAFFKLPNGGLRTAGRIYGEDVSATSVLSGLMSPLLADSWPCPSPVAPRA